MQWTDYYYLVDNNFADMNMLHTVCIYIFVNYNCACEHLCS